MVGHGGGWRRAVRVRVRLPVLVGVGWEVDLVNLCVVEPCVGRGTMLLQEAIEEVSVPEDGDGTLGPREEIGRELRREGGGGRSG